MGRCYDSFYEVHTPRFQGKPIPGSVNVLLLVVGVAGQVVSLVRIVDDVAPRLVLAALQILPLAILTAYAWGPQGTGEQPMTADMRRNGWLGMLALAVMGWVILFDASLGA